MKHLISTLIISILVSSNIIAQNDSGKISEKILKEYEATAKTHLVNLDTCVNLTKAQKDSVLKHNYTFLVETHHQRLKIEALQAQLQTLNREVKMREKAKHKSIKALMDENQLPGFRKAKQIENRHKSQQMQRERREEQLKRKQKQAENKKELDK